MEREEDGKEEGSLPPFAGVPSVGCGWRRGCVFGASILVASIFRP